MHGAQASARANDAIRTVGELVAQPSVRKRR
ncbi:GntR family transcriptional regulator [Burkholderia sp. MSMB1552]|uniref:GntR family transcriptional regulator n=1 Tax=Burkholderia humptydooensis TaxID=430531 RepID=A0A7U4SSW1_9BURK|nr:GntR family transcriptional regulator [Burkholderia humptydooensis]ATF34275.1 GntR family transcriptional regulator [Burkholderia thailandensis]KVN18025.1 GntR family transcriptional regulator [Burkholderia sp. MSMB1552]KWZ55422.1 GntR family transcriptional regulator [Burkholderia sp. MSMB1588]KST74841.1 GntR family transcriptional regulator [Burkholderia humptydooensis]